MSWFRNSSRSGVPHGFVYLHIPLPAYTTVAGGSRCVGMAADGITPVTADNGLAQALVDAKVRAVI